MNPAATRGALPGIGAVGLVVISAAVAVLTGGGDDTRGASGTATWAATRFDGAFAAIGAVASSSGAAGAAALATTADFGGWGAALAVERWRAGVGDGAGMASAAETALGRFGRASAVFVAGAGTATATLGALAAGAAATPGLGL